jgi:uncharacterized protein (TIGR04255 family)
MDYGNIQSLNNPPIKQVSAGLLFEAAFQSFDDILAFYNASCLKELFPKNEIVKTMAVRMENEPKITQDIVNFIRLTNCEKTKELFMDQYRILYMDSSKYVDFDAFSSKLYKILECFLKGAIKEFKLKEMNLRYINAFSLSEESLHEEFYIGPYINLTNDKNSDTPYAYMGNHLLVSHIVDAKNPRMTAVIKNTFEPASITRKLNIIFDIDTNLRKEYTVTRIEDLKEDFLNLKKFKNQIFFSNFKNAHNIKEFM